MSMMSFDYLGRQGITDARVLEALRAVPRDRFVPGSERASAYANRPLPIGHGQTISQPYVVAYMTQTLDIHTRDRVLEIGTGCGYQTAVLAELSDFVFSIEIVPELARTARETLDELGYHAVRTRLGNGREGWPEEAPFDAIMVTAAGISVPDVLIDQLGPGGRLIMPVGPTPRAQELVLLRKDEQGEVSRTSLLPVRFVPLTG
jgi:protein-L-isoaspartate(D-aspartate) O-methyltransferase